MRHTVPVDLAMCTSGARVTRVKLRIGNGVQSVKNSRFRGTFSQIRVLFEFADERDAVVKGARSCRPFLIGVFDFYCAFFKLKFVASGGKCAINFFRFSEWKSCSP